MFVRGITLSLAALLAIAAPCALGQAGQSNSPPSGNDSAGLPLLRHIPGLRILFGDDTAPQEETAPRNAKTNGFDESYYEPQPAPPPKQKKKAMTPQTPAEAGAGAPAAESGAKASSARQTAAASAKPAADGQSCEKAAAVISGYGFSDVTPANCNGKVYAFNAKRDGKSFAIKFDSASGDLAEVKKLP